jgi:hypothetical protein
VAERGGVQQGQGRKGGQEREKTSDKQFTKQQAHKIKNSERT